MSEKDAVDSTSSSYPLEPSSAFRVPRSRVEQTHETMRGEILQAFDQIVFGSVAHGQRERQAFELEFAAAVQQPFACAVGSGTMGLFVALRAWGVGPGDEVITVGNSDVSTTAAIRHCGATPVLCDVNPTDYTMNVDLVEPLITDRTRALLPVDLYGHPADVRRLRILADRYGLAIIEDAALAAGARDHRRPVGAFADVTVFSFAPLKPLGSVGNGAAVVTGDPRIAEKVQLLASYGHDRNRDGVEPGYQRHVDEGYNVSLDPLQAALLRVKLPYLEAWTARRREVVRLYEAGLEGLAVSVPRFRSEAVPTFRCYTVRVTDQHGAYHALRRGEIEAVLHYAPPVYQQPVYGVRLPGSGHLPVTEQLGKELVCLPVAPDLSDEDIQYVVQVLRAFLLEEA